MSARASTLLLVALLAAPAATAGWAVKGAYEPDTVFDRDGWMALDPDVGEGEGLTLYFNGFAAPGGAVLTTVNPNVALAGSSVGPAPFLPVALLGIWRDCNRDGYVGAGEAGLLEYRSTLLLDDRVCPVATPPPGQPWRAFNDGEWVVEFVPVGYGDLTTPSEPNPLMVNDSAARVWADWGLPGEMPSLSCTAAPLPHGALRSTGGLLRYADCQSAHRLVPAASSAFEQAGLRDLSFQDAPRDRPDRSSSPLNQRNPWGEESDPAMAYALDCRGATQVDVNDPTGGSLRHIVTLPLPTGNVDVNGTDPQGRVVNATLPRADVRPGTGSPAGTVNETQAALTDCDRHDPDEVVDVDRRRAGSDGNLPYALEGGPEPVSPYSPRTRTDHVFTFEEGSRGATGFALLGSRARSDAGSGVFAVTGFWVGSSSAASAPYVSREQLGPAAPRYITYYAYVSPSVGIPLGVFRGPYTPGLYGAEGCLRIVPTFECDPAGWWRDGAERDVTPRDARLGQRAGEPGYPDDSAANQIGVRVWQPYQRRDVDCIDASADGARELGAHWGALSGAACLRP